MILALITVSIGTFSVLRFVRRSRMLHPNEAHTGAGIVIVTDISSCGGLSWWRAGLWLLPPPKGLDDAHLAPTIGAWFAKCEWGYLCGWWAFVIDHLCPK